MTMKVGVAESRFSEGDYVKIKKGTAKGTINKIQYVQTKVRNNPVISEFIYMLDGHTYTTYEEDQLELLKRNEVMYMESKIESNVKGLDYFLDTYNHMKLLYEQTGEEDYKDKMNKTMDIIRDSKWESK